MRQITSSTLSNQNIASALLCHTYTADAARYLVIRLFADQVAGNGSYSAYITIQKLGTGATYQVQPVTTATVASGVTSIAFVTIPFPVSSTDVVKVYLLGLAGDTTTPDIFTGIWEDDSLRPTTVDTTLDISVTGEAGIDWANVGSPTTVVALTGTTSGLIDNAITAAKIAPDAIGASELSADSVAEIQSGLATATALATVAGYIDTEVAAIKAKTDNLPASPAATGDIPSAAAIRTEIDTNSTKLDVAVSTRMATFSYTAPDNTTIAAIATYVDTEVAAIKAKTDNLPSDPADASDIASALAVVATYIDTEVAAIKAKTDNLPSDPADASDISAALTTVASYIDTEVAAIKAKTDNLPSDPADASDISAALGVVAGYIDTEVAAIKAKTDNLPASPAATGDIVSASAIAAAVMAFMVESGHSFQTVMRALYAINRGKFVADDPDAPTLMRYYAPDGTTLRVEQSLTDITREPL